MSNNRGRQQQEVRQARQETQRALDQAARDRRDMQVFQRLGKSFSPTLADDPKAEAELREMKLQRQATQRRARTAALANGGGSGGSTGVDNMQFATGRPRDPLFYWKQNNLPYDYNAHGQLARIREYCNTPDAPVWMADYGFKAMGDILPGEKVIGWVRGQVGSRSQTRLVASEVLAVKRRMAPEIVRITMESGRVIRCTPDHKWANPWYSPAAAISPTCMPEKSREEYAPAAVGNDLRFVIEPTMPLDSQEARGSMDRVVSIESEGPGEVVSMQTETGNYTAWGYASKNCQLLYSSHSLIGSCVDIYAKYPILGMELSCHNDDLTEFHTDLFFNEDNGLDYENFFVDLGVSYWTLGEAFALGGFNEKLGVWESDELIHPNDVELKKSPFMKEPRFFMRLPETIREILNSRQPVWEYTHLMQEYPELAQYLNSDDHLPVSNVLMRQYRFKGDLFNSRGIPLLMRAMRPIMQEEMLNAALDSVADRMYTPLVHAKIGAPASDLGTQTPWIPTEADLADFIGQMDMAMAGDFRVMATAFVVQMESLFGRENMPDFGGDFDRIQGRILQTFGLSQTLLTGASGGETYAADALNKQLVSQLLSTYQRLIGAHYRQRALVVAEAQEHFDYEERGGKRYIKMEEVLEVDEETGEERIVEQPKLLIPDLHFMSMDLSDEEAHRQFFEQLHDAGVPISIKTRMVNIPLNLDDEIEQTREEQVQLAVAEQQTRKEMYTALKQGGLPIPQELRQDFEPIANQTPRAAAEGQRTPVMGLDSINDTPHLAPTPADLQTAEVQGTVIPGMPTQAVDPVAAQVQAVAPPADVPPESNEMREDMPKAASLWKSAKRMREIAAEHAQGPQEITKLAAEGPDDDKRLVESPVVDDDGGKLLFQGGKFSGPAHVGMRRYINVPEKERADSQDDSNG